MSPGNYMDYEDTVAGVLDEYGIPADAFNFSDLTAKLVTNDVTFQELDARIAMAASAATYDETFLRKFVEFTGMSPGYLAAFYLDPEMTNEALLRNEAIIRSGALMARYGFRGEKQLATWMRDTGLDEGGQASAYDRAARLRGLLGGYGATVSEDTLLRGSAMQGAEAGVVERAVEERQSRFRGNAGVAESREGVVGLRSAGTR